MLDYRERIIRIGSVRPRKYLECTNKEDMPKSWIGPPEWLAWLHNRNQGDVLSMMEYRANDLPSTLERSAKKAKPDQPQRQTSVGAAVRRTERQSETRNDDGATALSSLKKVEVQILCRQQRIKELELLKALVTEQPSLSKMTKDGIDRELVKIIESKDVMMTLE